MENKIIIAMDSFKGSATSKEVGEWVAQGLRNVSPKSETIVVPVADGGEGTVDALLDSCGGERIFTTVEGPLGDAVSACFGLLDKETAIIEMAEASGLSLTTGSEVDALRASTYGVGQLILAALDHGAKKIYIGIGGSATTDGGAGMAQAIGVKMTDSNGQAISRGAKGLASIASLDVSGIDRRIREAEFHVLSDVTNPLVGAEGAARIYGLQKGLSPAKSKEVDQWLTVYGKLISQATYQDILDLPGAGAAGGLGGALVAFTGATMAKGIDQILQLIQFEKVLNNADLCITGEGRMDNQSIHGKAPIGIAKMAQKHGVPVAAIVASRADNLDEVFGAGIDFVLPIILRPLSMEEAIASVKTNTIIAGETMMRAFQLGQK